MPYPLPPIPYWPDDEPWCSEEYHSGRDSRGKVVEQYGVKKKVRT